MKKMMKSSTRQLLRKTIACLTAFLIINGPVWAISSTDVIGTPVNATVGTVGSTTTVDVLGNRSVIEWSNFNTGSGETLEFIRDGGANFAVLNRILSGSQTQFDGRLNGNQGHIIVINQHGIVFGPTAEVSAHRFTASTLGLEMTDDDFLAGSNDFAFKTGDARGRISLAAGAEITADQIELLAHQISNSGLIVGTGNVVLLATRDEIYLASECDDIIVKITTPNTSSFNYTITNEADGTIKNDTGKVVLAAGDTFAQALSGINNQAYAVGDYNIEQRGTIQAAELEAGAAQQIALRPGGSTEADSVKVAAQQIAFESGSSIDADAVEMFAQKIEIDGLFWLDGDIDIHASHSFRPNADIVSSGNLSIVAESIFSLYGFESEGEMDIFTENSFRASGDVISGGSLMLQSKNQSVYVGGRLESVGDMNVSSGTFSTLQGGASSGGNMTLGAGTHIGTRGDLIAQNNLTLNANVFLGRNNDQVIKAETGSVFAGRSIEKLTPGSLYIDAKNNIRLDGDVTARQGGVSVISGRKIHTGEGDALNIKISGYSNHAENAGVDLPYNGNNNGNGNDESNGGKAAIVLKSREDLTLGSKAELYATGSYAATPENGVDDRAGVNFLDQDAVIGGYERDQGVPIDVAIYVGSIGNDDIEGNVFISENATIRVMNGNELGDATVVLDARDTVSMPNASVLSGGFRLEAASRISEWLYQVEEIDRLPGLSDVEGVLGEGNYVRRGAGLDNLSITDGQDGKQWVLENPDAIAAPLAVLEIPELKGCPVEMQAAAIELGISDDTLQMTIRNSLAMNPNIQPCDACASLVTAATILNDADGVRLAAMNQIFNTLAPADAPFTPEVSASVVTAFAQLGDQDRQYALAAEYIDAFARYVAVLDTELKAPVGDPVAFALEKHGDTLMGEQANPNIAAYILSQIMPEGI